MEAKLGLAGTSDAVLVIALAIDVLLGVFAYAAAVRHRSRFGVAPWRLAPWGWSLLIFMFPPLLVLFALAVFTTRPNRAGPQLSSPASRAPGSAASRPFVGDYGLGSSHPPPLRQPLAGWYPDPGRRHEERYWDGKGWSEHVRDQGVRSIDPG